MTNDAKLGMLAGVLGVVIAAVFFTKPPPQPPDAPAKPQAAAPVANTPATPGAQPEAGLAALPSTPVPRTRKDVTGQSTSRRAMSDEEP